MRLEYDGKVPFQIEELVIESCPNCGQNLFIFKMDVYSRKWHKACFSTLMGGYCFKVEIKEKTYNKIFARMQKTRDLQGHKTKRELRIYPVSLNC